MNEYEDEQEARKERLLERAEKAEQRAAAAEKGASDRAGMIPMGQPILVGHHSERRHRRDLERINRGFDKAHEERAKAEELRRRAAAVGRGGISSDDPSAVAKLKEKLRGLEERREKLKAANAAWRRRRKRGDVAIAACYVIEDEELRREAKRNLELCPFWSAPFLLTNIGAEVRRVRARIESLKKAELREAIDEDHGICRLVEAPDDNRVRLYFDGKPAEEVRAILKRSGLRWSRSEGAWQRHLNDAGRTAARSAISQIKEVAS